MHWNERLSEYLDGELSSSERAACDAHLAECPACRTALEEIQLVTSLARADEDVVPASDLWPGILERIEGKHVVTPVFGASAKGQPSQRRISFTLPQLALAASLLIAVSAGVAYCRGRTRDRGPASTETPIQAMAEPMMPPSADIAPANFADAQFDRAVSDLESILVERRDELDPRTVMVIERNLAAIDEAIRQARTALDADPANQFLNSHLAEARRRKLDLLRHATTSPRLVATDRFQETEMNRISLTVALLPGACRPGPRAGQSEERRRRATAAHSGAARRAGKLAQDGSNDRRHQGHAPGA